MVGQGTDGHKALTGGHDPTALWEHSYIHNCSSWGLETILLFTTGSINISWITWQCEADEITMTSSCIMSWNSFCLKYSAFILLCILFIFRFVNFIPMYFTFLLCSGASLGTLLYMYAFNNKYLKVRFCSRELIMTKYMLASSVVIFSFWTILFLKYLGRMGWRDSSAVWNTWSGKLREPQEPWFNP